MHNNPSQTHPEKGRLLNKPEIAEYLHTTERNVSRLTQGRYIPTVKIGRRVMAWSTDLDRYIEQHTRPARPDLEQQ